MDQVRVILVSIFPALWVVASGYGLYSSGSSIQYRCVSITARQPGRSASAAEIKGSLEPRFGGRRLSYSIGDTSDTDSVAITQSARPESPRVLGFVPQGISRLTRPWQFHLRAAMEPRAPSLVG